MLALQPENSKIFDYLPSDEQLVLLKDLCILLKPLAEITELFSGSKYPTVSILIPTLFNLVQYEIPKTILQTEKIDALRKELIRSFHGRFKYIFKDEFFWAASLLDFRFRGFDFIENGNLKKEKIFQTKELLITQINKKIKFLNLKTRKPC